MKKILIGFVLFVGLSLSASNAYYNTNMDKKIYYNADRSENERLEKMSEVLDKFITSEANETLVQNYKNGKLKLSTEELELQQQNTVVVDTNKSKKGFFSRIFSFGSKKEDTKQKTIKQETNNDKPGFFAKLFEKIGIGSTKKLPVNKKQEVKNEKQ